jgi:serine/threonine protein kinase
MALAGAQRRGFPMRPEQWRTVEELYQRASDLPHDEQPAFLRQMCGTDGALLKEVESLLRHGAKSQSILDTPAITVIARDIAIDGYAAAPLSEGQTFSHYRILKSIGQGGMGVVYAAEDTRLRRRVALKLLPTFMAGSPQALRRFEREAQAASALNHPNICTVYEIDEAAGLHFIAIELLEGETVKERITRGAVEALEILAVGDEICDALEAAHSAGIVHRDIKPSNIFITRNGTAKLLDFGVAKRVSSELASGTDEHPTASTGAVGTIAYMSPEQAGGQEVDNRSDLFSLGAVLYEMTTGKCLFPSRDLAEVIQAIHGRNPVPIEQLNSKTPPELIRIIKKALHKDLSKRYQRAADMRHDLQSLRGRFRSRIGKRRAWLALASVITALALIVLASLGSAPVRRWMLGSSVPSAPAEIKSLAVLPLANLTGDPSQDYFVDGMTDALITNLTKLSSLRVISRTSSMHYKETRKALPEIGRELNVNAVVEGSVVRSQSRVRISAQLVDAATGQNLWTREYERDLTDVIQLQNELSAAVAQEVVGQLTSQEWSRLTPARATKPEVYEAYLKGRYFSNRPMEEGLKKGVAYFQEAIRLDPDYAPAYAGLADAYSVLGFVGDDDDRPMQLAIEAAKKSLSLDDSLAEAHASLGFILHRHRQDWTGAEKEYHRAIELNPSYATAHLYYGIFLRGIGQDRSGCRELQLAHELDPMNPRGTNRWAECVYAAGHFDQAVHMVKDILEIDPNNLDSLWALGEMYERKGMFPEAIEQYERAKGATDGKAFIPYSLLASAYAGSGQTGKAEQILEQMKQKFGEDEWISATVHVRMGRKELAIRELTEDPGCVPGNCGPAASLYVSNWRFDPLRSDPRFQALLRKFNYPESAFRK